MDKNLRGKSKSFKNLFRLFLVLLSFISSFLLLLSLKTPNFFEPTKVTTDSSALSQYSSSVSFQTFDVVEKQIYDLQQAKEAEIQKEQFDKQVARVEEIFAQYGGYLSGYASLIINRANECGGDYRIIVAIAGNESGFGKFNYKLYNPFGYLDGVQYAGFEEALYSITCKISQRFLVPCNQDIACVVVTYGGSDTDKPQWIKNITFFKNLVSI